MNVALIGCGRMGEAIALQATRRGHVVVARRGSADHSTSFAAGLAGAEVAFEFTTPDAARANVRGLLAAGVSVVCGTTGWEPERDLSDIAQHHGVALVVAPNFSLGMQAYYRIVRRAAEVFGALGQHDPFVFESHHRGKRDAPSGTARRLAEIVMQHDARIQRVHVDNPSGLLPADVLPIASVRAGAEPGTHVVGFDGEHDRVTLRHAARGREGFALGAVMAAEWIAGRRGSYAFEELVDGFLDRASNAGSGGPQ